MPQTPTRWMVIGALAGALALAGAGVGAWAAAGGGARPQLAAGTTTSTAAGSSGATAPSGATGSTGQVPPATTSVPDTTSPVPRPSSTTSTTTTTAASPPGTLVVTQASAGQTFDLTPGQRVQVVLPGTGQQYHGFTVPVTDDAAVAAPDGVACGAPSGSFCTEFVARAAGTARLTSTDEPACRQSSPPCEVASQVWWVNLQVS